MNEQISMADIEKEKSFTWKEFNMTEPKQRKARWNEFKEFFPEHAEVWEEMDGCQEIGEAVCSYANGGWCDYQDFPCAYNPFLTPRTGYSGMACMGMRGRI